MFDCEQQCGFLVVFFYKSIIKANYFHSLMKLIARVCVCKRSIMFCSKMWFRKFCWGVHKKRRKDREKTEKKTEAKAKMWVSRSSASTISTCLRWLLWLPRLFWERNGCVFGDTGAKQCRLRLTIMKGEEGGNSAGGAGEGRRMLRWRWWRVKRKSIKF